MPYYKVKFANNKAQNATKVTAKSGEDIKEFLVEDGKTIVKWYIVEAPMNMKRLRPPIPS